MAKSDVTGMSIKDILKMPIQQINSMNRADLSAVASRLVSASNKRIRRLEASPNGKMSPSYLSYKKRGKPFSVKGKDVNQLRNEMKQMKKFLSQKTSSVSDDFNCSWIYSDNSPSLVTLAQDRKQLKSLATAQSQVSL